MKKLPALTGRTAYGTPSCVLEKVSDAFGGRIHLDPAGDRKRILPGIDRTLFRDSNPHGLNSLWHGNVYVNPPYGDSLEKWFDHALASHLHVNANVQMLVPANTSRECWRSVLFAASICFIRGRLTFHGCKNCAAFSSAIILWGDRQTQYKFEKAWRDYGLIVRPI